MKTIKNVIPQGEVLVVRVESLPTDKGLVERQAEDGLLIVAHSETGHHHAIAAQPGVVQLFGTADPLESYISVRERPVQLDHYRTWDTHETLELPPGDYKVRHQREYTPQGWRKVVD